MAKEYKIKFPKESDKSLTLREGLIKIINCRDYLKSQGFNSGGNTYGEYSSCLNGKFIFSNSAIDSIPEETVLVDSLLSNLLSEEVIFKRAYWDDYIKKKAVRFFMEKAGFSSYLGLGDSRNVYPFFQKNRTRFQFLVAMQLKNNSLNKTNLGDFEKYTRELEEIMSSDCLQGYVSFPQKGQRETQEIEVPEVETKFINPWGVEIPKLGGKK